MIEENSNQEVVINKQIDTKTKDKSYNISISLLSRLRKQANELNSNSVLSGNIKQGFILGYEDDKTVELNTLYNHVFENLEENIQSTAHSIVLSNKNNRLDFIPLGLFFITDDHSLTKVQLNSLLQLRGLNPQSVVAFYSPSLFSLTLKRLTFEVVSLNTDSEIRNYQEYPVNLYNKQFTSKILEDVKFQEKTDKYSLLSSFNDNTVKDQSEVKNEVFLNNKL